MTALWEDGVERRRRPPLGGTTDADVAIVGAGMAGASLAAALGGEASVLLLEGEDQPGYHSTGRSAAFWSETYGGPFVSPSPPPRGLSSGKRGC